MHSLVSKQIRTNTRHLLNRSQLVSALLLLLLAAALLASAQKTASPALADGEYLITQYADASGAQATCYTIENENEFYIIDGGWAENEAALRKIIAAHGNHVNGWIISHPHQDHAGAFNAIYANPGNITVDAIYDNSFDYDFIESVGEPYDDITVMERYVELTANDPKVTHLKRGDVFSLGSLSARVLNAWDEYVLYTVGDEKDYQNNGSLLLVIENQNSSMLFCSDIKYDMDDLLSQMALPEISCDYVQVGHHGNWSFSTDFYEKTGASVFFIDAPAEITENENFPAKELKESFLQKNGTVYDFSTAPNYIILD